MARPLSGASAPKGHISLIERFGGIVAEPTAPTPTGQTVSSGQQMASVAPATDAPVVKKTRKKAATSVDKPAQVKEVDEIAAHKKKMESEKAEKDIRAYAAKKAQAAAVAKLAANKK